VPPANDAIRPCNEVPERRIYIANVGLYRTME